jgi:hypothetical protein
MDVATRDYEKEADSLQVLVKHAVAHVEKGEKAAAKAEEHYKAAGIYIKKCKEQYKRECNLTWPQFCKRAFRVYRASRRPTHHDRRWADDS